MNQSVSRQKMKAVEGKECPRCGKGVMVRRIWHDPMLGNGLYLECSRNNPCGYRIEVVADNSTKSSH